MIHAPRRPIATAQAKARLSQGPSWLAGSALLVGLALLAGQARAQDAAPVAAPAASDDVVVTHGYSYFGDLNYPADFPHLDYVNPDAPKGGEMSQWFAGTFDGFNPYTRGGNAAVLSQTPFEAIVTTTADDPTALYCYLCTTMEYPADLAWVIFNLRDDVTFSDGTPMTAEDIKFSYDTFMSQGLPEFRAAFDGQITQVEVLDLLRIRFSFGADAPRRDRIGLAATFPPFSQAEWTESGRRLDETWQTPPLGTGAYLLGDFDYGRTLTYVRNPNFWGADLPINVGRNNFDSIRIEYFADGDTAFEAFKAGEYTFRSENSALTWATGYDFPGVQNGSVIKTELPDGNLPRAQSFIFNLNDPVFQDPAVRAAIRLMFNFEWSNETLFYGLYERTTSFWANTEMEATGVPTAEEAAILQPLVNEGLLDATILTDEAAIPPVSSTGQLDRGNLRAASALLEEAGWVAGSDGIRRKDGQWLDVTFLESSPAFDRVINPYVENLKRLGVNAVLDRVDPAQEQERTRSGDWDVVTHSFSMSLEPGTELKQWFGSETAEDSSRNLMALRDPAVDSLIDTVIAADTTDDMHAATRALDRVLRANGFWVPQWFKPTYTVAYYDMFEHPADLPPYALGETDFWWFNADKAEALRASGALR
ncbi:microcin C transport system substrate-binding protein [Loktanella fryxellensis]|uniref:Microcin C transport system substrate-binding protein n=1 Tax=Loktanella fryxellensis TaxID=245187 RepID=A0A1H8AVL3_9RHOB|nr:extracellular solute-binding protein [Loktanella fryxellensis]SEM74782.1 microcin C transport system substrate-binding protein [Loktanella fryxellensis]